MFQVVTVFQVVTSGLRDPMSSPVPGLQVAGSPAGSGGSARRVCTCTDA